MTDTVTGPDRPHSPFLLSVVLETANEAPEHRITLQDALAALKRQTIPIERCEVLVVLPRRMRALAQLVQSAIPHTRILFTDRELGYGQMKMAGAKAASCEIVACTDADCLVEPDWVESILEGFRDASPQVAALQGLSRLAASPGWPILSLHYFRAMWAPSGRGRYIILNNFAIRREMVERYPFADVNARQNVERLMIQRMLKDGYQIRVHPGMRAIHNYEGNLMAWFRRGRAEAFDRLETLHKVYTLIDPPERVAWASRLDQRLRHHTRRLVDDLKMLGPCWHELGFRLRELPVCLLAATTVWVGACVGAVQARPGAPRPHTDF